MRAVVQMTAAVLPAIESPEGGVHLPPWPQRRPSSRHRFLEPTAHQRPSCFTGAWRFNEELRGHRGQLHFAVCSGPHVDPIFCQRAGLAEGSVPNMFGETSEKVVLARRFRAVASGAEVHDRQRLCWKNKVMTAVVT